MKVLFAALVLVATALAQTGSHCYKDNNYVRTEYGVDTIPSDTCEFSNGNVHTWTVIDDESWSKWYTRQEWKVEKARRARLEAILDKQRAEYENKADKEAEEKREFEAKVREAHDGKCKDYVGKPSFAKPYYCPADPDPLAIH